jgi:hypothetical protein
MFKVNTQTLSQIINAHYREKVPLLIFGPPGCGKSEVCAQTAKNIAEKKGKKYSNWADLTLKEKMEWIENPEGTFVFCDQRISQMDSTDLRGIPNMANKDMLESLPQSWIIYFTKEKADGVIFFDEINLAAPIVAGSAYQIIHDRCMSDRRLSKDVFLVAAGNRQTDKAYTFEMPFPLKDRFDEVELQPDIKSWTEWAAGKVNPHIIAFLNWKESNLFKVNEKGIDKGATPRGWTRGGKMIGDNDITSNNTQMFLSLSVGEAAATEFKAYVKFFQSLDWDKIYKNPEIISKFETDKLYTVAGGLCEHYTKYCGKGEKKFDTLLTVVQCMPEDFCVLTLRLLQKTNEKGFAKDVSSSKVFPKLAEKFGKYFVED